MGRTILLADDSPTIRKIVELTFSDSDYRIEVVATGSEALQTIQQLKPDLVLADVVMPQPDGYDLCRAIKESEQPVPVLLLAGTFEPFDEELARACGADGHLVKPFESRTLKLRVEETLARGPTLPAAPTPAAEDAAAAPEPIAAKEDSVTPLAPEERRPAEVEATVEDASAPDPGLVDAVAREVIAQLSTDVIREIAWEVVPDLATKIIRDRIRELERDEPAEE
jgi:CheY-like chemotaxis protein